MKVYCFHCKYIYNNGADRIFCRKSMELDCIGRKTFSYCKDLNSDYHCENFEPSFLYKNKYKRNN